MLSAVLAPLHPHRRVSHTGRWMTSRAPLVFSPITSQLSDHRLRHQSPISKNCTTSKHSFKPPVSSHLAFILTPYHITPFYFLNCTEQSLKPFKNALTVCFLPDFPTALRTGPCSVAPESCTYWMWVHLLTASPWAPHCSWDQGRWSDSGFPSLAPKRACWTMLDKAEGPSSLMKGSWWATSDRPSLQFL